jgi:hypothetical protein
VDGPVFVADIAPLRSPTLEPSWFRRNLPSITLVVLAFGIPELLTGSTTLLGLVTSLNLALGLPLYGSGVLLAREASLRWRKGWSGILFLGLAYGIVEEGIATKTMINPASTAASTLGSYGHFLGVSWIFAVEIDLFHAVFSIALPILLVSLLWPERRTVRLISDRALVAALVVLALVAALGFFVFTRSYVPSGGVVAFLLGAIAALVVLFFAFPPERLSARASAPTARPRQFGLVGGAFVFTLYGLALFTPFWRAPPVGIVLGMLVAAGLTLGYLVQRAGRSGNELQKVAFAAGLLAFWVPWDIALDLLGDVGVIVVPVVLYYLLYRLYRRYRVVRPNGPAAGA